MADRTKIPWTDATWNPVVGCTPAGEGCRNCYARELHERRHRAKLAGAALPAQYARPFSSVQVFPERISQPLRWRRGRKIFACSTGDLFLPEVPDEFIAAAFGTMAECQRHIFQVLTKRSGRIGDWFQWAESPRGCSVSFWLKDVAASQGVPIRTSHWSKTYSPADWPLPNVWLGCSASTQDEVEDAVPTLLKAPAAIRFLSLEPLLGPVDFREVPDHGTRVAEFSARNTPLGDLDWVIIGAESGLGRRPCHLEYVRDAVAQCRSAGVAVFVKQLDLGGRLSRDPAEWPEDLRVQEWPR